MTVADDLFLAGVHIAKTAGSTVAEHARTQLGEPAFHYYCRFTRTRRFWAGLPQYEELPEEEKQQIRLIFGHGVRFNVVTLQDRIPEFFTTIRHPVSYFHSRFTHESLHHERRATRLPFEAFLTKEKHNQFSWLLVASFGELAEFGDEISYRNSVSILRNFKYIFATEQIDAQSPVLWNALGVSSGMERKRVAGQMEHVPLSDEEILAMNPVDMQLYEEIAAASAGDVDGNGALNPFGYEPEKYFDAVARKRNAQRGGRQTQIEKAYRELANRLAAEGTLEAALESMCNAPHVEDPATLRETLARKRDSSGGGHNEQQREPIRRNADANRKRCASAARQPSSTPEQDPGVTRPETAATGVQEPSQIANYRQVLHCEPQDLDKMEIMKPGEVLVYVHLPKAAGNSSIGALRGHFPPYVSVNWRKPKEHVKEIVANWNDDPVHFISGHINHGALAAMEESGIPHACITFLRHPVERIISSYRYNTSAKAPGSEALLARHPTLEHFVFEAVRTNEISRFMLGKNVRSLDEYKAGMEKFRFVGVSEMLPFSHFMLSTLLNIPFDLPGRANVTDNPSVSTTAPQRVLDYLYTTQQMDVMFHAYVLNQFCLLSSALIASAPDGSRLRLPCGTRVVSAPRQCVLFLTDSDCPRIWSHFDRLARESPFPAFACSPSRSAMTRDYIRLDYEAASRRFEFRRSSKPPSSSPRPFIPGTQDLLWLQAIATLSDQHSFEYFWFIEYDVDFSGHWADFFTVFLANCADLIAMRAERRPSVDTGKWWPVFDPPQELTRSFHVKALLPVVRFSRQLVDKLGEYYDTRPSHGHQEIIVPTLCNYFGMEIESICGRGRFARGQKWMSATTHGLTFRVEPAGMPNWYYEENPEGFDQPNVLWHPVKVEGSPNYQEKVLRQRPGRRARAPLAGPKLEKKP